MPPMRSEPDGAVFYHVPTPGDHYSPATGSAVQTVIYELSRRHQFHGGGTRIIVGSGTRHDYPVGECVEVDFPPLPTRWQKLADVGLGRLGISRPFSSGGYRPASRAIGQDFDGPIFIHNSPAAIPALKRQHPTALVCLWAHNLLFRTYSRREVAAILSTADRVICVSEFLAADLASHLGRSSDKICAVLNGVDPDRFRPAPSAPDAGVPVVLFIGRITPEKGPDLLIQAARKIHSHSRPFKLRIVGSSGFNARDPLSAYELDLRKLADPIQESVEFQPFVDRDRVLREYQAASIFCVPSNCAEGCGLTVSESMACGLPVIAARRGGIPEVGQDAVLYFSPPSVDQLAERLACLLDDEAARREWGARARNRAEQLSWEHQYQVLRKALQT